MNKAKVLMLSIWYPLSMSRYFERAFRRRDDVELVTVGPYTDDWIPWGGAGMRLPRKYAVPPDVLLPIPPDVGSVNWDLASNMFSGDDFDLILDVDAGIHWDRKPQTNHACIAHVATDPHALNYGLQRTQCDKFFNMQRVYSQPGDIWLPYAYDPTVHYPVEAERKHDAVLVGMPYPHRINWINVLNAKGIDAVMENGPIFDEYRELACSAPIGLNWSSLDDLNARFFELMAMRRCAVMNWVTDAEELGFDSGTDYIGFGNLEDGVQKVSWALNNQAAVKIAESGYATVKPHTYDARVQQILTECGLAKAA